uniref:RING-type domain-containing protein n=1 Tax=Syphacia muris TaxID=451379 RepID=A0A0N5APD0_9BILA
MKVAKTASQQKQQLNENILCKLCQHYIIDAVTILECVHSFCRSCLLKHLKESKTCPLCKIELGPKFTKAFKRDFFLQSMVYKLVPHVYWNEIKQRAEYLRKSVITEEEIGFLLDNNMTDLANHICAPYEKIPLCIEYVRSASTQEEADEDSMDSRCCTDVVGTSSISAIEPDEAGPSGLNCNEKVINNSGSILTKNSKKKELNNNSNSNNNNNNNNDKMEVDEVVETNSRKGCSNKADKRSTTVEIPHERSAFNVVVPEFKRYFLAEARTKLSSFRKVLEGKLKVRENGVQLLFLDIAKNSLLEDACTLQDIAYMFGWDRRESMKIFFTLQREPTDDEPPVLTMEEMPVLHKEEPFACQEEEKSDHLAPVISPVVLPPLTVTLDAAAMEGSGKQQPIIVTGPTQPPRKRRKVSSPTKRTSRTPPYPMQRMTGLSPHEKAPPMMQPQREARESNGAKKNFIASQNCAGPSVASGGSSGHSLQSSKQNAKSDQKSTVGEKQENLNSRIHEILVQKGLSSQTSSTSAVTSTVTTASNASTTSGSVSSSKAVTLTASSCIPSITRPLAAASVASAAAAAAALRASVTHPTSASSCIVPANFISQLNGIHSRADKASYEEFFRQLHSMPRFFPPGGLHSLCDPRIAQAPIKSVLSVPQTDVVPYLRPPPPSPYPNLMQQLSLKRKQ